MNNKQAIEQLKDLKENLMPNGDHKEDFEALDIAIKALEGTAQEVSVQAKIKALQNLCKPVAEHLKEHYDPHCTVVITDDYIKLVEDTIGIPVRSDD